VSRIFLSHSSHDNRQALALRAWLVDQDPPLANDIFLDTDPGTGLKPGVKWKNELISANSRCEAVICLLSANWEASPECLVEYRTAENMGKQIVCARLQDSTGRYTSEWQHTDLFTDGLPEQDVETIAVRGGAPVVFAKAGLHQLRDAIRGAGIAADNFVWPPPAQPDRAPYRGWEPFEELDGGVFFGRDAQIVRALDMLRTMRTTGIDSLFVIQAPSGSGKSSFLRAGLLPRLRREDRHFVLLDILRPEHHALTGDTGLAHAIYAGRRRLGLEQPALGDIEIACSTDVTAVRTLLAECRLAAAHRVPDADPDAPSPTLVLPLDQAEELFTADAGPEAAAFLELIAELAKPDAEGQRLGLIVAGTIRTDRYEVMQTAPQLAGLTSEVFDDLKPMPDNQFREVITGPADRTSAGGHKLRIAPDLVNQLLEDVAQGGDALPLLALTLRRIYDRYAATGELTLASYEAMGGMERVVQSAVDEVLSADPEQRGAQLAALRAAFIPWLATINPDNDQPMRRVARYSDLPEPSRPLIDAFVEKRLLVKDQRGGEVVVEVALESLLRQWDDLAGWLREERQSLIAADDIERTATAWHSHHDDPAWLLTGTRLADAETLASTTGYRDRLARQPSRDYLKASRQAENQRLHEEEERRQEKLRHAEEVARLAQERQRGAEALAAGEIQARKRAQIVAVVALVSVLVLVLYGAGVFNNLERRSVDVRFSWRGSQSPGDQIAIVGIDQSTLQMLDIRPPLPRADYAQVLDRVHAASPRVIGIDVQFIGRSDPADDNALLAAIARDGPVLLATHDGPQGPIPVPADVVGAPGAVLGSAGIDKDPDGVLRRMLFEPARMRTLGIRAAEMVRNQSVSAADFPGNHAWIDFRGPPGTFPHYSFADVMAGTVPASAFTGKAVFIGVTDPVGEDLFVTSMSSVPMPGVEINANALWTVLAGLPLKSAGALADIALILVLIAIPAALGARKSGLLTLVGSAVLLVMFLAGVQLAFNAGWIVTVTYPIVGLLVTAASMTVMDAYMTRRRRAAIEQALGNLVHKR
jgi:CHASE2 domain-containing sensor protein